MGTEVPKEWQNSLDTSTKQNCLAIGCQISADKYHLHLREGFSKKSWKRKSWTILSPTISFLTTILNDWAEIIESGRRLDITRTMFFFFPEWEGALMIWKKNKKSCRASKEYSNFQIMFKVKHSFESSLIRSFVLRIVRQPLGEVSQLHFVWNLHQQISQSHDSTSWLRNDPRKKKTDLVELASALSKMHFVADSENVIKRCASVQLNQSRQSPLLQKQFEELPKTNLKNCLWIRLVPSHVMNFVLKLA